MPLNLSLLLLFVLIQAADVLTTLRGLQLGATEAAPLGRSMFPSLGFWPTVLILKGVGIAAALAATLFVRNAYWFTGVLDLIGAIVLWNNVRVLRGRKSLL